MSFDPQAIRRDFPMLEDRNLVYLDNGATTLKPRPVIKAITDYYSHYCANVHRGLHRPSQQATQQYEGAREITREWIGADKPEEVIFTSGTTGSLNLLAHSYGSLLSQGDEVLISTQEHHSNIIPWQLLQKRKCLTLKVLPLGSQGEIELEKLTEFLSPRTKIISLPHVSNTLGTINPIASLSSTLRRHCPDAVLIVDGAQAIGHLPINVQELGVDFYCFSSHKVFGPTGIGVLYGKEKWLHLMPPFLGGGDMVDRVTFDHTTFAPLPQKFEAGTPHIAGAIGLGAALSYLKSLGIDHIQQYEKKLLAYGTEKLSIIPELTILGGAEERIPLFTFTLKGIQPHDLAMILNQEGVAVRTGHHCTMPLLKHFQLESTTRASLAFYNTKEDIDRLVSALQKAKDMLS